MVSLRSTHSTCYDQLQRVERRPDVVVRPGARSVVRQQRSNECSGRELYFGLFPLLVNDAHSLFRRFNIDMRFK